MLQINHIDELRSKVAHKEEIRESDIGEGYKSFCYMIAADGTFDDAWSRECRGIVFDRTGKVAARPLHKFFNVNEREETQVHNLDWSKVVRVMEKRDGSMIHTVKGDWTIGALHGVRIKSKKSFDSDVAKAAWPQFYKYQDFCRMVASLDATAIFEYTAPDARIVLYYPDPELKLLHIRDNVSGKYWELSKLRSIAELYGVKMVEEVDEFWWQMSDAGIPHTREFDVNRILEAAETRENIEGWVIQFENGEMVKLKTK